MIWAQALIVAWLLACFGLPRFVALITALASLLPVHGVSLAMALRGLWGDPSITTLLLLPLALSGAKLSDLRGGWRLPALIATVGVLLYTSALGHRDTDLYRFGYQPAALLGALGSLALLAWWRGQALYLWLLAVDLFAWQARWLESANLWDYVLDPLLVAVMLVLAVRNGYRMGYRARQNQKLPVRS